jgi:hypothetical protein
VIMLNPAVASQASPTPAMPVGSAKSPSPSPMKPTVQKMAPIDAAIRPRTRPTCLVLSTKTPAARRAMASASTNTSLVTPESGSGNSTVGHMRKSKTDSNRSSSPAAGHHARAARPCFGLRDSVGGSDLGIRGNSRGGCRGRVSWRTCGVEPVSAIPTDTRGLHNLLCAVGAGLQPRLFLPLAFALADPRSSPPSGHQRHA